YSRRRTAIVAGRSAGKAKRNHVMSSTFEPLEDRRLFAVGPTDMVSITPIYTLYSPITVNGTPYADNIYISNDGAGHIVVNNDGAVSTYSDAWTSSITVNADSGNDYVWTASNINHPMIIHGGDGSDYLTGGNMNDPIHGGGDTDPTDGQAGNDNPDGR